MSVIHSTIGLPMSILDTDLYKFTMQQAVLHHFPTEQAVYRFVHRDKGRHFPLHCIEQFEASVACFSSLTLTDQERDWLKGTCPYFTTEYLDYLAAYRFKPEQVHIKFSPVCEDGSYGDLEIEAIGPWVETILWEVPLMACLSEVYFRTADTDWSYEGQAETAYEKAKSLLQAGCVFSEFGTRRRRSFRIQDLVVATLIKAASDLPEHLAGTSNVYLAKKHCIKPVGTIAHEWFMAIAGLTGYEEANTTALALWEVVYPNMLLIALTDTFSTKAFFAEFVKNPRRARHWHGLRQDSGDPFVFAPWAKKVYEEMGIDYKEKVIFYSDALNKDKALGLQSQCDALGFSCVFGIGTFLTNDFNTVSSGGTVKSPALNMVIKISSIDGKPCIKISDDIEKHQNTGDPETVQRVKELLQIKNVTGLPCSAHE